MRYAGCDTGLHTGFVAHITHLGCGLASAAAISATVASTACAFRSTQNTEPPSCGIRAATRLANTTAGACHQNHFVFEPLH